MTKFDRFKEDLTKERFIDIAILNCEGCPAHDECQLREGPVIDGGQCEEVLSRGCDEEE